MPMTADEATQFLASLQDTNQKQGKLLSWAFKRIATLETKLDAFADMAGPGVKQHLAKLVTADEENPAQPVPQPAGEAPEETSEEALAGDSGSPVKNMSPGGGNEGVNQLDTPGSTNVTNVAPLTTTTVDSVGADVQTPAYAEDQDVEKPVAGTEGPRPLNEVKIEHEVEAPEGDYNPAFPTSESPAFPDQKKTTSAAQVQSRTLASIRLARLRVNAGVDEGDDLDLAEKIAASTMSDEMIQHEIRTLESVKKATKTAARPPRHLVPTQRQASVEESRATHYEAPVTKLAYAPDSEEFLFD